MNKPHFPPKDAAESVVLLFNFADALAVAGATLVGTPSVSVTTGAGTDPVPEGILNGAAAVVPTTMRQVTVPVKGGRPNVNYDVKVVCPTTDPKVVLALTAVLPVV